jgi:cellulose synthase/poly-beta-1,6-N-acetylglucosamine synthase-like glycosyltransferase
MPQGWVERIPLSETIRVSVVIPHFYESREDNFSGLLEELRGQSFQEMELIVVHGVSPQGKAINQGVREAKGEVLVIIDDDSRIGHPRVIENLVRVLRDDASIGMAGASVVIPEGANWFQRTASKQFPRFNMPVVQKVTASDLPGHPCAAFPKEIFMKVGMEREDILRGLDPDLRVRIRQAGYRVVLAPETWIHHPLPEPFLKFVRTFLRNGYGSAYLQLCRPEINYVTDENLESNLFVPKRSLFFRILRYPVRLAQSLLTFQWIRFVGYTVYTLGYLTGILHFTFSRRHEL